MSTIEDNNKRMAKNTIVLYFRMFFILAINLYSSRLILQVLGVEDFGISNVVGGVVSMMGILNASLSASTQRFLNYSIGEGFVEKVGKVFSASILLYFFLCVVLLIVGESIGLWFVKTHLTIPETRIQAAAVIYQFSLATCIASLLTNPFTSLILSHERMEVYAYVSILEAFLKILTLLLLDHIVYDKLELYGFLTFCSTTVILFMYGLYCNIAFPETKFRFVKDKELFTKMLSFSGWNVFGSGADIVRLHGINILLNMFFTPAVNAAQAIAIQVNNAIYNFFSNFYKAVYPQIIKNYAQKEYSTLFALIIRSSKLSFFLIIIAALPIAIEAPFIIEKWLGSVPEFVVPFVRIIIWVSAFDAMSAPIMSAANATGRIAIYQTSMGIAKILNLPISYIFLKLGYPPLSVFFVNLAISFGCMFLRVKIVSSLIEEFPVKEYFIKVYLNVLLVTGLSSIIVLPIKLVMQESQIGSLCMLLFTFIGVISMIWLVGLDKMEKSFVKALIAKKIKK